MFNFLKQKEIGIFPFLTYKIQPSRITKPLTFYNRSLYFAKALDKRASVIGSVEYTAYKGENEDKETQRLLDYPNDFLSKDDFWDLAQKYYDLHGVYYIWKETTSGMNGGKIKQLQLLDPTKMEMKFDGYGNISHFKFDNKINYEADEIIFEHRPSPEDPREPMDILNDGAKDVLRTEIELREYQRKIARSGGRINGVFSFDTDKGLSRQQLKDAKESYIKQIKDANESEEGQIPFFLGGKASYVDLNRSPQEIQYLESQKAVLEEISAITGVPKTILSAFDDIKYSNAEEARKTFLSETIKPLVRKREATLNQFLAPEGVTIEAEEIIPEDTEKLLKTLETANSISAMTINEKRVELGLEPIDNGDEILVPMNLIPYKNDQST